MYAHAAIPSANTSQTCTTSARHQRHCFQQCWSKICCQRCAARNLALCGRPAQERQFVHGARRSTRKRRRHHYCRLGARRSGIESSSEPDARHQSGTRASSGVAHGRHDKKGVKTRTVSIVTVRIGRQRPTEADRGPTVVNRQSPDRAPDRAPTEPDRARGRARQTDSQGSRKSAMYSGGARRLRSMLAAGSLRSARSSYTLIYIIIIILIQGCQWRDLPLPFPLVQESA